MSDKSNAENGSGKNGAIDNDYDDNVKSYTERVAEALEDVQTTPMAGGIAIDIVTQQQVYVRRVVATNLKDYYEEEGFDLATYKTHPYLPGVDVDNRVFECVYVNSSVEKAHRPGRTYDFPEGRLVHYPVEQAWTEDEVGSVE